MAARSTWPRCARFDAPSYDGDVQDGDGFPPAPRSSAGGSKHAIAASSPRRSTTRRCPDRSRPPSTGFHALSPAATSVDAAIRTLPPARRRRQPRACAEDAGSIGRRARLIEAIAPISRSDPSWNEGSRTLFAARLATLGAPHGFQGGRRARCAESLARDRARRPPAHPVKAREMSSRSSTSARAQPLPRSRCPNPRETRRPVTRVRIAAVKTEIVMTCGGLSGTLRRARTHATSSLGGVGAPPSAE